MVFKYFSSVWISMVPKHSLLKYFTLTFTRHKSSKFEVSGPPLTDPFRLRYLFFANTNRGPSICVGGFLLCVQLQQHGLSTGCPIYARSKRHHWCAFGKPACTWFGGCYQRWRPLELSFFAVTLQSKVHNAVRYFNIGPHCVPIRDIKRCV